jgi:hypothetical protein
MKKIVLSLLIAGFLPFVTTAQEKGKPFVGPIAPKPGKIEDQTRSGLVQPPKSFSRNSWRVDIDLGSGRGDDRNARWDDRLEFKVERLERKIQRMEEVIDYLLYLNDGGGRHAERVYRCSMAICTERDSFFCDSHDFRTAVAVGRDRVQLFDELKRRGVSYQSDSFSCTEL